MSHLVHLLCLVCLLCAATSVEAQGRPDLRSVGVNGPKPGTDAPDFSLMTVDGKSVQASVLWKERPTVIVTASHTCPVFRGKVAAIEAMQKEFAGRVNFVIVYTIEAHPQGDPSPYSGEEWVTTKNEREGILFRQPVTGKERAERARACIQREKMTVTMVVDSMENMVWKAYGKAPNCAYVIGKDGKIIESQPWMDAVKLMQVLQKHTAG